MYPATTSYRLCVTPGDYRACHQLQRDEGPDDWPLSYPTVYALRDGIVVGFCSSHIQNGVLYAGPLLVHTGLSRLIFVGIRLVEAFETVLRRSGVTQYFFKIDKINDRWQAAISRLGAFPARETEDCWVYRRDL